VVEVQRLEVPISTPRIEGKRELKDLECNINCDTRSLSTTWGKSKRALTVIQCCCGFCPSFLDLCCCYIFSFIFFFFTFSIFAPFCILPGRGAPTFFIKFIWLPIYISKPCGGMSTADPWPFVMP